jgi:hypothetical protein
MARANQRAHSIPPLSLQPRARGPFNPKSRHQIERIGHFHHRTGRSSSARQNGLAQRTQIPHSDEGRYGTRRHSFGRVHRADGSQLFGRRKGRGGCGAQCQHIIQRQTTGQMAQVIGGQISAGGPRA